jgi:hypothetical protein
MANSSRFTDISVADRQQILEGSVVGRFGLGADINTKERLASLMLDSTARA